MEVPKGLGRFRRAQDAHAGVAASRRRFRSRLLARGFVGARVAQLVSRLLGRSGAINRPGGGGGRWLSGQWRVNHPGITFLLSNDNLRYHVSIIQKRSPASSHIYPPRGYGGAELSSALSLRNRRDTSLRPGEARAYCKYADRPSHRPAHFTINR